MYPDQRNCTPGTVNEISGLLSHLSVNELREILNEDVNKLKDALIDNDRFKTIETDKEILLASNRSLAEFNLAKEPILKKEKNNITELSELYGNYIHAVEEKMKQLNEKTGNNNLEKTYALLQTATAETEEETEKISQQFLDGNLDIDTFIEEFINKRKLMHLRKVKTDKMSEMISRRASTQGFNRNLDNQNTFYQPSTASQLPYPRSNVINYPYVLPNHFG